MTEILRLARVSAGLTSDTKRPPMDRAAKVAAYLPARYKVIGFDLETNQVLIAGYDYAGWTMEGYVIPRLGSGLWHCEELKIGELENAEAT